MSKIKVAILGSGNIGTDLMYKLEGLAHVELSVMIGIDPESEGLRRAKERGYEVIDNGIDGFLERPELAEIIFDATTASAHLRHDQLLQGIGKKVIDLTPAAIGPYVVPAVNLSSYLAEGNVNMVTCGGQATIPIIHAIHQLAPVEYAEIVATISSKSAGPGTRDNIDEFTRTTARAIETVGGAKKGKAIIILNPAEPPIMMRDTIHVLLEEAGDPAAIRASIEEMVEKIKDYVPGYRLINQPQFDGRQVTVFVEVEGAGDFFPPYSGNLDIMTAAAARVGDLLAAEMLEANRQEAKK